MSKVDKVEQYILSGIEKGEWRTKSGLPSLDEMAGLLGVHRSTAELAVNQLIAEGVLKRGLHIACGCEGDQ